MGYLLEVPLARSLGSSSPDRLGGQIARPEVDRAKWHEDGDARGWRLSPASRWWSTPWTGKQP